MILSLDLLSKPHGSVWKCHFNVENVFQVIQPLSSPRAPNSRYNQHIADVREMNF